MFAELSCTIYVCVWDMDVKHTGQVKYTRKVDRHVCTSGLEAQLLGIVVRKERPELEEQKDQLVLNIAAGKKKLQELEDEILR